MHRLLATAALALALTTPAIAQAPGAPAGPATDPAAAAAGTYVIDPAHASVVVRLMHLGLSHYAMSFNKVDAKYSYDPKAPTASKIEVSIDSASLDTGIQDHSEHFANDFMGAKEHPKITFVSTAIEPGAGNTGKVVGDLTLNGVTKPVTLDVTYRGFLERMGSARMGFSGKTVVKRSDFGLKAGLPAIGDDVEVTIEAEFKKG